MAASSVIKEARAHSLDSVFNDHYAIPDFQRPFIWKRKHIWRLFDDLHDAFIENRRGEYFIGSIVVFRGRDGRLNLVDGQQRVITLAVLNCAFRDRVSSLSPAADTKFFETMVRGDRRSTRGRTMEEDRVYAQTDPDREILAGLIQGRGEEIDPWHYPGGQRWLVYAYKFLLDRVASTLGTNIKVIRDFGTFVAHNVHLVRIETDGFQSALQIFETINETGVNLAPIDLVKNYLFTYVSKGDRVSLKTKWASVAEHLDSTLAGSRQASSSTRFLRYFIMSQFDIDKDRVVQASGVYDWVKTNELKDVKKHPQHVMGFARELEKVARSYAYIDSGFYPGKKKHQWHVDAIRILGIRVSQHVPLLMAARQHPDPVIDLLATDLERMVVIYTLSAAQWNEIESVIPAWSREIRASTSLASMKRFLAERVRPKVDTHLDVAVNNLRNLGNLGDSIQRYVLARLTQYVEDETGQGGGLARHFETASVTIEHILAQHPSGAALDPFDSVSEDLDDYIYALGNLCLLFRVKNSMVGNKPFAAKKEVYSTSPFLLTKAITKSIGAGVNTKYTRMERRLRHFAKWNPPNVEARTKNMLELANAIWKLDL